MRFASRLFQLAKDTKHPEQCEDACRADGEQGIAVIGDGVSSAIFSRQWAGILIDSVLANPPEPGDPAAFAAWLAERRQQWNAEIDTTGLAWFQKAKLPMGAFSTLLWVHLDAMDEEQARSAGAFGGYRLRGYAIGDSCLFHLRGGELVRSFPIQRAEELEADPVVLGSVDLNRDELMQFVTIDEHCFPDDLLVLCTDAVAEWALRRQEAGNPPDWSTYWEMTQVQWEAEIAGLRERREMRYDDATLMLLHVCPEGMLAEEAPAEQTPAQQASAQPAPSQPADAPQPAADVEDVAPVVAESIDEPDDPDDDWKDKLKSASKNFAEGVELMSDQAVRGWKKWSKKAAEKVRQKADEVRKRMKGDDE